MPVTRMRRQKLRVRTLQLLTMSLVVLALGYANVKAASTPVPPPLASLFGGSFSLVDHNGNSRTDKDFHGKFMLIYFGYTYCPDICPTNLQEMANALEVLGEIGKKIQPVFISIDPERDTSGVLKEYVANFGARFIGLTGTEAQIRAVTKSFRVHRRKVTLPGQASNRDYLVDHSSLTHLIGPDGKFRTLFPHNTKGDVMAKRLHKYLKSNPS